MPFRAICPQFATGFPLGRFVSDFCQHLVRFSWASSARTMVSTAIIGLNRPSSTNGVAKALFQSESYLRSRCSTGISQAFTRHRLASCTPFFRQQFNHVHAAPSHESENEPEGNCNAFAELLFIRVLSTAYFCNPLFKLYSVYE